MAVPQVSPPPVPTPYWYIPPPRDDSKVVTIVIIVIVLVILIPIVLSAILFFMIGGLLSGPGPAGGMGNILGPPSSCGTGCWDILVYADPAGGRPLSAYTATLLINNVAVGTATPAPGVFLSGNGWSLAFFDRGQTGVLDAGDDFRISTAGGASSCGITIAWSGGSAGTSFSC